MPLFDLECVNGHQEERFLHHRDLPNPACSQCGGETRRLISSFAVVWTGAITARYNDRNLENAHQEGHYVMEKDGKRTFVSDFQTQREVCKRNGWSNPSSCGSPTSGEINSDGTRVSESGKAMQELVRSAAQPRPATGH